MTTDIASTTGAIITELFPTLYFVIGLAVALLVFGIIVKSFTKYFIKLFR